MLLIDMIINFTAKHLWIVLKKLSKLVRKPLKKLAKPNLNLIRSIRSTARKLQEDAPYQWGHMGSCNCGNLAQEIARISKADIHSYSMYSEGSWTDQSREYCPTSGLPMDLLISNLLDNGLELKDLEHLEKLSDPAVLKSLGFKKMRYNLREHVVKYMEAWADLLEEQILSDIQLSLKPTAVPMVEPK